MSPSTALTAVLELVWSMCLRLFSGRGRGTDHARETFRAFVHDQFFEPRNGVRFVMPTGPDYYPEQGWVSFELRWHGSAVSVHSATDGRFLATVRLEIDPDTGVAYVLVPKAAQDNQK